MQSNNSNIAVSIGHIYFFIGVNDDNDPPTKTSIGFI